jgi:hypothetical protein
VGAVGRWEHSQIPFTMISQSCGWPVWVAASEEILRLGQGRSGKISELSHIS